MKQETIEDIKISIASALGTILLLVDFILFLISGLILRPYSISYGFFCQPEKVNIELTVINKSISMIYMMPTNNETISFINISNVSVIITNKYREGISNLTRNYWIELQGNESGRWKQVSEHLSYEKEEETEESNTLGVYRLSFLNVTHPKKYNEMILKIRVNRYRSNSIYYSDSLTIPVIPFLPYNNSRIYFDDGSWMGL